ncbi:MAG: hypothetical protein AAF518_04720 [Spirochaetota bacterium]
MEQETDYAGLLDRLEVVLDRVNKPKVYSRKRRNRYHKLGLKQIELLREILEPLEK